MAGRSSGRAASSVGMMEGAFFVPRTELINWANNLLQISLTKVEQCASGAVYCQIIDSCHPNTISMKKVNWMAKADHEFLPNYKVLQAAFDKAGIARHIDVDKLIRAKYQDNLEFLQFMKCYWEHEGTDHGEYDPTLAREGKSLPAWAQPGGGGGEAPVRSGGKENLRPRPVARVAESEAAKRPTSGGAGAGRTSPGSLPARPPPEPPARRQQATSGDAPADRGGQLEALRAKTATQSEELEELRQTVEGLEHERDYYFRKLREVEILCTNLQTKMQDTEMLPDVTHKRMVSDIQDILYAEIEEQGGEGEVSAT